MTAGPEHIIALLQRSMTIHAIMQHGVVYENVYLWNKHQLRGEQRRSCAVFENTDTDLREHGQFFGEVHNSCDGRGDDLGELTEGLQVDFVIV